MTAYFTADGWRNILAACCSSGFLLLAGCTPVQSGLLLAKGLELMDKGDLSGAEVLFRQSEPSETVGSWALFYRGKIYAQRKEYEKALQTFSLVPINRAASIDARLSVLSVTLETHQAEAATLDALRSLEEDCRFAWRSDLLPDISYLKGRAAEDAGDIPMAHSFYQYTRKWFAKSSPALHAKDEVARLVKEHEFSPSSFEQQHEEADILLKEGEPDSALNVLNQAESEFPESGTPRWEAKFLRAKILYALQRKEDARRVLAEVGKKAPAGIADRAMLQLIQELWNANESPRALQLCEELGKKFPKSAVLDEMLYTKGRILEELNKPADAETVYGEILLTATDAPAKLRALRQRAWLRARQEHTEDARNDFAAAAAAAREALAGRIGSTPRAYVEARTRASRLREILDELAHAEYWKENFGPPGGDSPEALRQSLAHDQPFGYYASLLREKETPSIRPSSSVSPVAPPTACTSPAVEPLHSVLETLHEANLPELSAHEIDWSLANPIMGSAGTNVSFSPQPFSAERLLSRAAMYAQYSHIRKSLDILDNFLLSSFAADPVGSKFIDCKNDLIRLSYPLPNLAAFTHAAKANKLPLSLLLSVARIESHFDEKARSPRNAMGLLQLLPKTAEDEGLTRQDDLFKPAINIELGAKFLARLLRRYNNETIFAVAAYNAGPAAVDRWRGRYPTDDPQRWTEFIGYSETKTYVKRVFLANEAYHRLLSVEFDSTIHK